MRQVLEDGESTKFVIMILNKPHKSIPALPAENVVSNFTPLNMFLLAFAKTESYYYSR